MGDRLPDVGGRRSMWVANRGQLGDVGGPVVAGKFDWRRQQRDERSRDDRRHSRRIEEEENRKMGKCTCPVFVYRVIDFDVIWFCVDDGCQCSCYVTYVCTSFHGVTFMIWDGYIGERLLWMFPCGAMLYVSKPSVRTCASQTRRCGCVSAASSTSRSTASVTA